MNKSVNARSSYVKKKSEEDEMNIVTQLALQAFLNIAVASNAIPNTGVSFPFLSYGGTALMMQLAEMGIVLNISRKAALD